MPLTGWICPACNREVPLDHFEKTACGEVVHPDYASAILKSREGHYAKGVVEVSHGLGCPRSYAIQQSEPYGIDPLSMNAPETGTAWHAHMERASVDPANTEVLLRGTLGGVPVTGKCDRLRAPYIEDWKHANEFRRKYLKEIPEQYMAQLSMYAELVHQCKGWRPTHGIIWFHFSTSGKDALLPMKFRILPIEAVLELRPHGGEYTVAQLLGQADSVFGEGAVIQHTWNQLPLSGESQMFGANTMCNYCPVVSVCKREALGAPF